MEINKRAHPGCVHAANPYHECTLTCLEQISAGQGRKGTNKQARKLLSFTRSLSKKRESESPRKPQQNGSFKAANYPAKDPPTPLSQFLQIKMEKKSFSFEEPSVDFYSKTSSFDTGPARFSVPTPLPENNLFVQMKDEKPKPAPNKQENGGEKNSVSVAPAPVTAEVARNLCSLILPWPLSDDEDEEVKSVISDSCVSVGKYKVRADASSTLQSILDKHGDIASNCKLQSAYILSRYLECVCSVVQELQSTKFEDLDESKVQEMSAVLKDVETMDIDVAWLRRVLEAIEAKRMSQDREKLIQLVESTRKELGTYEESLVQKEKDVATIKRQVEESRTRLSGLELEASRFEEMRLKVQKLLGKPFGHALL